MADKEKRPEKIIELPDYGVKCTIPERPSVREQLAYWSAVKSGDRGDPLFLRAWEGAVELVQSWECDFFELNVDLDAADDPRVATAIEAIGLAVFEHMNLLKAVPKN